MNVERAIWALVGALSELDEVVHDLLAWLVGHVDELRRRRT